jgi:CRISPR/Cas system-associated exonuclease Cas4 (RecB family)
MPLPKGFRFSQSSLQDYADCPRRFELRYIRQQAWPAVPAQPILEHEEQIRRGEAFHRLLHQHAIGLPADSLAPQDDADLQRWWAAYREQPPAGLTGATCLAETTLSTLVGEQRLVAKYDLLAWAEARVLIVDWKTDHRRPSSELLRRRLQTAVYLYVAVEAGPRALDLPSLQPGRVTMVYWFAEFPAQTEEIQYDAGQHETNRRLLGGLIAEIAAIPDGSFPLTADERKCHFCIYRSLCDRGAAAGNLMEADESVVELDLRPPDLDLEQVAEISY